MMIDPMLLGQIQAIAADIRGLTGEDDACFWDTLDGECDALEMLDGLIAEAQQDAAMEAAARELAQRFTKRAQAFKARSEGARRAMRLLLQAIGERKVVRPGATLSLKAGVASVEIHDPASVPTQLRKPGDPDKSAIRAQLEAGEDVPGCRLVVGEPSISVRIS